MDILTHAISGVAIASCTSTFTKPSVKGKCKILAIGLIGGILPDIDAISMWSKFDSTIGHLFNLPASGKIIYSSKYWYSHHAFFHSLLASVCIGLFILLLIYLSNFKSNKTLPTTTFIKSNVIYLITFVLAYWAHLAGDLPTPSSSWGGIAFFWPSGNYIGGYGKIWWWNNYDIFLLILLSIIINLTIPVFIREKRKYVTTIVLSLTLILISIQINNREYNYNYSTSKGQYAEMEQKSKEEQKRILGNKLYSYMAWFDGKMKFYF
ncbi:inner membrane protein [Dysgonomonas sp. PFB1-18]|uniref:metal-dependent hydrolase n=1 Tax=unclassified Dysgonomonas TaxID=2630389 RepID=UPI002475C5E7|nr:MULTISPECIES: metal-dependent hydrolase [unclassified Dysgonomonas]MDH6307934.1 inner membrane protein [Dysgonomonas sp. PF1-14]MDH6337852.1 inner membrane protein [Dysgonomonas sp. PF1-16]MDH6379076.1 inner membrane protein [Dysgonomonas sp. PFB1-18]MDH6396711.1 inner membrane protein [Dysgonomonas sp. PF1-23]